MVSLQRVRTAAEAAINPLVTSSFLIVWLCCWPVYRLYHRHHARI